MRPNKTPPSHFDRLRDGAYFAVTVLYGAVYITAAVVIGLTLGLLAWMRDQLFPRS